MLWGARRVTIGLFMHALVPLDTARVAWGDGDRMDLPRDQLTLLQAGAAITLAHVYSCAATPYDLQVTVVGTDGQQTTASALVFVKNQPPCVTMDVAVIEQTVTVTPAAADSDGEVVDITLYWGGQEGMAPGLPSGQPVSHQYPGRGGLWDILTTATDDEGASASVRHVVALLSADEATAHWGDSPGARWQERKGTAR
ncbi:MAG: hypothetical protein ACYC7E_04580 [Armatimonadota bacterium]